MGRKSALQLKIDELHAKLEILDAERHRILDAIALLESLIADVARHRLSLAEAQR